MNRAVRSKRSGREPWQRLRVGDRVRIVRMPSGVNSPGYTFHPETRRLYRWLIERGRSQRVFEIDEWGVPWIECRFPRKDRHPRAFHILAINDDSWVRVKPRRRTTSR